MLELEQDKRDLERQVNEQKSRCDQTEKRSMEAKLVEEKKHSEEVQFLKKTNQQLKVTRIVLQLIVINQFCFTEVRSSAIDQTLKSTEITAEIVILIFLTVVALIIIMQIYIMHTHETSKSKTLSVLPV